MSELKEHIFSDIDEVPCIVAADLNEKQAKALRLADNKVAE